MRIYNYTSKKKMLDLKIRNNRDCLKRKWRQDWDMNDTLYLAKSCILLYTNEKGWRPRIRDQSPILSCSGIAISLIISEMTVCT